MKTKQEFDGVYNIDVQRILLAHLIENPDLFKICRPIITDKYFDDELRRSVRFIIQHFDEYGTLPSEKTVQAKTGPDLPDLDSGTIDPKWFVEEMQKFCRYKATENIILDGFDLLQKGEGSDIEARIKAANAISLTDDTIEPLDIADMDFTKIEPRAWIYGRMLIRGFVSCMAGPGGNGKTSLAMGISLAVASGRALLAAESNDEYSMVRKPGAVLYWNLEDPQDEMRRRTAAEIAHRNISPKSVAGKFFSYGRDHPLCVARLDQHGRIELLDVSHVIKMLRKINAVLLTVDPTVMTHFVNENDNAHLNAVLAQFRHIAQQANCAILLLHHFRKGGQAGDGEAARGAVALHAGCRVMETVTTMTIEDATALGVPLSDRKSYVRKENAKANMSPASQGEWFRFNSVSLHNGNTEYPDGDSVGVLTRWQPLSPLHGLSWNEVSAVLDQIEHGEDGEYYSSAPQSKLWIGGLLMTRFRWEKEQAKFVVKEWLTDGLLTESEYTSPTDRKKHMRLIIDTTRKSDLQSRMENRV